MTWDLDVMALTVVPETRMPVQAKKKYRKGWVRTFITQPITD